MHYGAVMYGRPTIIHQTFYYDPLASDAKTALFNLAIIFLSVTRPNLSKLNQRKQTATRIVVQYNYVFYLSQKVIDRTKMAFYIPK